MRNARRCRRVNEQWTASIDATHTHTYTADGFYLRRYIRWYVYEHRKEMRSESQ